MIERGFKNKMKLVIAEKPSVANSIARVLGAKQRKNGYIEGNGYLVSWCFGHLVQMAGPDSYDEKYLKWRLEDLPIMPENYKYIVSKGSSKQFNILKKLLFDKRVEQVVNACDAGREGESIFRLVYNQAKCKKPILRLWISSLEDRAIKDGFEKLEPGEKYDNLFQAAEARSIADWLVGINLSRFYSIKQSRNYSVGRVQTPTLAIICGRDNQIASFVKEKYFTLEVVLNGFSINSGRIDDLKVAESLLASVPAAVRVDKVQQKVRNVRPERLYDLTTLQRAANKVFGYSAQKTLDIAQGLYEKKLITYPRTDSRHLTQDMKETAKNIVLGFESDFLIDEKNFEAVFDDSKVTDHYAIIPTLSFIENGLGDLSDDERRIYYLIKAKLLMAFSSDKKESLTRIICNIGGQPFVANGKVVLEPGFSIYAENVYGKEAKDVILPSLSEGDVLDVLDKKINEKFTKPPQHYTEETLLKAMEIAGNDSLEKGVEVERKGIGTPATRAGIIETLIRRKFIKRCKKNLVATEMGHDLVSIVAPRFKSAKMTAVWEMALSRIAAGEKTKDSFLGEIERAIKDIVV